MFYIVNLLTRWLFQPEAPGDRDDMAMVAGVEGEPSGVEEITEDQIQADSPKKDAEAHVDAERAEV
jgi:hypothetical protein